MKKNKSGDTVSFTCGLTLSTKTFDRFERSRDVHSALGATKLSKSEAISILIGAGLDTLNIK